MLSSNFLFILNKKQSEDFSQHWNGVLFYFYISGIIFESICVEATGSRSRTFWVYTNDNDNVYNGTILSL